MESSTDTRTTLKTKEELREVMRRKGIQDADLVLTKNGIVEILSFYSLYPEDKDGLNKIIQKHITQ